MQIIEDSRVKEKLYVEKLPNGLTVMIIPKKGIQKKYVIWGTNYGSNDSKFIVPGETEETEVPKGVAHFLEHKMFEQESGINSLDTLTALGVDANAYTTNDHTAYLFECTENFYPALDELMDYVQHPYFTDANVEKEKGIIGQEIMMYDDYPEWKVYLNAMEAMYHEHPVKLDITGTIETISHIDKEILYKCYNTFYNPSNMFVVITGKVDKDKVFQIIEENQNNKTFEKMKKIDVKTYDEPDEVFKEKEVLKMNVTIPKISLNYKFNLNDLPDNLSEKEKMMYLSLIFDINFGPTSLFNEQLKQMEIINSNIEISSVEACNHVVYTLFLETENKEKAIELVSNEINKLSINEEQLERKKKGIISSNVFMSDNIFSINHKIMSDIVRYNHVITDIHSIAKSLNIKDAKNVLKKLKFNNYSIFIVDKK